MDTYTHHVSISTYDVFLLGVYCNEWL